MSLHEKIITHRKKMGMTQEELASLTQVTTRTIQRIENMESVPRDHTLKAIAKALNISFDELKAVHSEDNVVPTMVQSDDHQHFLKLLCLSCFSYIVIPYLHFLIPHYILKHSKIKDELIIQQAQQIIRLQIYWLVIFHVSLLLTLCFNMVVGRNLGTPIFINYLWPFFIAYLTNFILISWKFYKLKRTVLA